MRLNNATRSNWNWIKLWTNLFKQLADSGPISSATPTTPNAWPTRLKQKKVKQSISLSIDLNLAWNGERVGAEHAGPAKG